MSSSVFLLWPACIRRPYEGFSILDAGTASLEHSAAGAETLCNLGARMLSRAGCGEGSKGHGNVSFSALLLQWTPVLCKLSKSSTSSGGIMYFLCLCKEWQHSISLL